MSEEFSTMIQIMQFYGRSLDLMWRGIKLGSSGMKKGVDLIKIKQMQHLMKVHFASLGTTDAMQFQHLEKLTGGNWSIYNIPTENEKVITQLFDALKKMKIPFAKLPDLVPGDDQIQIAFDPRDQAKIKQVLNRIKQLAETADEITLDDYVKMDPEQLTNLAKEGYDLEQKRQIAQTIKERNQDKTYVPISINIDSKFIRETDQSYVFSVPKSIKQDKSVQTFEVPKSELCILDSGQTVVTHLKKDKMYEINGGNEKISGEKLLRFFATVDKDVIKRTNNLPLTKDGVFANFGDGMDFEDPSLQKQTAENVAEILKRNDMRNEELKKQYIPFDISDFKETVVAETEHTYRIKAPDQSLAEKDSVIVFEVDKKNAFYNKDTDTLNVRVKKHDKSNVYQISVPDGKMTKKMKIENPEMMKSYLKTFSPKTKQKAQGKVIDMTRLRKGWKK